MSNQGSKRNVVSVSLKATHNQPKQGMKLDFLKSIKVVRATLVFLALMPSHSTTAQAWSWSYFKKNTSSPLSSSAPTLTEAAATAAAAAASTEEQIFSPQVPEIHNIFPWLSAFSKDAPLIVLPKTLTVTLPSMLKSIFLYKPPVGITAVYVFFKLILNRNNKRLLSLLTAEDEQQAPSASGPPGAQDIVGPVFSSSRKFMTRSGRSFDLDSSDRDYDEFGGVDYVRAELYGSALMDLILLSDSTANANIDTYDVMTLQFATAVSDALKVNVGPRRTREFFVEKSIRPLSRLESLYRSNKMKYHNGPPSFDSRRITTMKTEDNEGQTGLKTNEENYAYSDDAEVILWGATKVAEIRTLDALLRILRDRLLTSANRLSRAEKHCIWRLRWYEPGWLGQAHLRRWFRKTFSGKTLADDRRKLQLTSAALQRELERLGQVQKMLLVRPKDLSETVILTAASLTMKEKKVYDETVTSRGAHTNTTHPTFNFGGSGARAALKMTYEKEVDNNEEQWSCKAKEWTNGARSLICDVVTETMTDFSNPSDQDAQTSMGKDLATLVQWSSYEKGDEEAWSTALALVDNISKARLVRERSMGLVIDLQSRLKRLDVYGIPSSLATVGVAMVVHNTIKPHWPDIVDGGKTVLKAIWGVIEFRFWEPLRDIVLDLLNRRPRLLDPFTLENEETSLDNMLRDLGIGDGQRIHRDEALAAASRMYEEQLAQGALKNMFAGKMVRLLLIQVQQLKAGLLKAMGSIDDLVDSNRLNVQLLASIPAFLLVTFGTRVFFSALFSLRSQNLVGLPTAHAEMSELLRKMERCLLLASYEKDVFDMQALQEEKTDRFDGNDNESRGRVGSGVFMSSSTLVLEPHELGEFLLHLHSYLLLLDLLSPPFPSKASNSIHSRMQDLLMQGQLSTKRQIALLQLINVQHGELLKSL